VHGGVRKRLLIVDVSYLYAPHQNTSDSMISSNRETVDRPAARRVSIYDLALCWLVSMWRNSLI